MKPSVWNVLKFGVGGVLSLILLSACADGRGSNGFRAYQYSKEEMAFNKANADAKAAKDSNLPVVNGAGNSGDSQGGGNNNGNAGNGNNNGGNAGQGQQTALPPEALDNLEYQTAQDSAKSKELIDNKQEPLQVAVDQLRKANELAVTNKKVIPQLQQLVKGVTVTSTMNDKQVLLNIDALVLIDGADHIVSVQNAAISYLKDGVTTALSFRLKKGTDLVIPGKKLIITALCKDESCTFIHIRFMFENRAAIVVGYKQVDQGVWILQESNIDVVKSFDDALNGGQGADLNKKVKEAAAAKQNGQQLSDEQKAALAAQKAQEEAQAKLAQEAQLKAEQEAAEKALAEKKASEDAAILAAGGRLEKGYEEAAAAQAAATPEQAAEVKQDSEEAAAYALGYQFEGAFDREAQKQQEAAQQGAKEMTPASGDSTEQADPFFTPQ